MVTVPFSVNLLALLARLSRDCRKRVWSAWIVPRSAAIDDEAVAILCRTRLDRFGHLIDYGRRNPAPALGQDTDQILKDCGFANSRIEAFRRSGIHLSTV